MKKTQLFFLMQMLFAFAFSLPLNAAAKGVTLTYLTIGTLTDPLTKQVTAAKNLMTTTQKTTMDAFNKANSAEEAVLTKLKLDKNSAPFAELHKIIQATKVKFEETKKKAITNLDKELEAKKKKILTPAQELDALVKKPMVGGLLGKKELKAAMTALFADVKKRVDQLVKAQKIDKGVMVGGMTDKNPLSQGKAVTRIKIDSYPWATKVSKTITDLFAPYTDTDTKRDNAFTAAQLKTVEATIATGRKSLKAIPAKKGTMGIGAQKAVSLAEVQKAYTNAATAIRTAVVNTVDEYYNGLVTKINGLLKDINKATDAKTNFTKKITDDFAKDMKKIQDDELKSIKANSKKAEDSKKNADAAAKKIADKAKAEKAKADKAAAEEKAKADKAAEEATAAEEASAAEEPADEGLAEMPFAGEESTTEEEPVAEAEEPAAEEPAAEEPAAEEPVTEEPADEGLAEMPFAGEEEISE